MHAKVKQSGQGSKKKELWQFEKCVRGRGQGEVDFPQEDGRQKYLPGRSTI